MQSLQRTTDNGERATVWPGVVEGSNAWGATAGRTDRRRANGSGALGVVARAMPGMRCEIVGGAMRRSTVARRGAGRKSRTAGGDQTAGTVGRDGGGRRVSMERGRSGAAGVAHPLGGWLGRWRRTADSRYGGQGSINQSTQDPCKTRREWRNATGDQGKIIVRSGIQSFC